MDSNSNVCDIENLVHYTNWQQIEHKQKSTLYLAYLRIISVLSGKNKNTFYIPFRLTCTRVWEKVVVIMQIIFLYHS